jgi:hypothetical protein
MPFCFAGVVHKCLNHITFPNYSSATFKLQFCHQFWIRTNINLVSQNYRLPNHERLIKFLCFSLHHICHHLINQYYGIRAETALSRSISDSPPPGSLQIQGDSGEKVDILGGNSIGLCEKKNRMNMSLILNYYRGRAVWISRPNSVWYLFVGFDERWSL